MTHARPRSSFEARESRSLGDGAWTSPAQLAPLGCADTSLGVQAMGLARAKGLGSLVGLVDVRICCLLMCVSPFPRPSARGRLRAGDELCQGRRQVHMRAVKMCRRRPSDAAVGGCRGHALVWRRGYAGFCSGSFSLSRQGACYVRCSTGDGVEMRSGRGGSGRWLRGLGLGVVLVL